VPATELALAGLQHELADDRVLGQRPRHGFSFRG
jgi:hypothetical protein